MHLNFSSSSYSTQAIHFSLSWLTCRQLTRATVHLTCSPQCSDCSSEAERERGETRLKHRRRNIYCRKREIIGMIWLIKKPAVAWATSRASDMLTMDRIWLSTNLRHFYNINTGTAKRCPVRPSIQCRPTQTASCWPSVDDAASGEYPSRPWWRPGCRCRSRPPVGWKAEELIRCWSNQRIELSFRND